MACFTGCTWLPITAVLAAMSSGCLLDEGPYQSAGAGASISTGTAGSGGAGGVSTGKGGAGGTGATGATGGTGGAGGSTSSTTMPPMCMGQSDCPSPGPCVDTACKSGKCESTNRPAGTPVSNDNPKDCVKQVCDDKGAVTSAFDDSEIPANPGGDCFAWACKDGVPVKNPINGGGLCGSQPADPCQKSACDDVNCTVQPANDGMVVDSKVAGSCNDSVCSNGGTALKTNDENCPPAAGSCKVAVCNSGGACGTKNLGTGTVCQRTDNHEFGLCTPSAHCCNLGGCD